MSNFKNWSVLFKIGLKKDWKKLSIWVIGLALFSGGFLGAFKVIGEDQGLIVMFETMLNPAMISMVGTTPIKNALLYTVGAMYAQEMLLFSALCAYVVASFHTVSRTRKEEDEGISELLRSFVVGRYANSLAVVVESILIHILMSILIVLIMLSFNEPSVDVWGIVLFASSIGFVGFLGCAVGLLCSEMMPNASAANSMSISIVGVLYLLRALTDILYPELSYWNPLAWSYLVYPFTLNQGYLILLLGFVSIGLIFLSFRLGSNRDLNSSYIPERLGRNRANGVVVHFFGLFMNLNRTIIISWLVGLLVMGAAYGSIFGDIQGFLEGNEFLSLMFSTMGVSIEESFASTIIVVLVCLSAFLPIAMISRLFLEERKGRLSMIFVSRSHMYWTSIIVSLSFGILGLILAVGGLGVTAVGVLSYDSSLSFGVILSSGLAYIPFITFVVGLTGLFLGSKPSLMKYSYAYVGFCLFISYFGELIRLPNWIMNLSIISLLPAMPVEAFSGVMFVVIVLVSLTLCWIGNYFYCKRDFCG